MSLWLKDLGDLCSVLFSSSHRNEFTLWSCLPYDHVGCLFIQVEWARQTGDTGSNKVTAVDFDEHNQALYSVVNNNDVSSHIDKYLPDGTLVWSHMPATPGVVVGGDLTVGKNHIYYTTFNPTDKNVSLHRLTKDNQLVWTIPVGSFYYPQFYPVQMANDWSSKHIFLLSTTSTDVFEGQSTLGNSMDMVLVKFNKADGSRVWFKLLGTTGSDTAYALAVDPHHQMVYVAGTALANLGTQVTAGGGDACLIALNADTGDMVWQKLLGGTGWDSATAVKVDNNGNVYVTGFTNSVDGSFNGHTHPGATANSYDGFVAKHNINGVLTWMTFFGGLGYDQPTSMEVIKNRVIVAGHVFSNNNGFDGQTSASVDGDNGDCFLTTLKTNGDRIGTVFLHVMTEYVTADRSSGDIYLGGYSNTAFAGQAAFGDNDGVLLKNPIAQSDRRSLRG